MTRTELDAAIAAAPRTTDAMLANRRAWLDRQGAAHAPVSVADQIEARARAREAAGRWVPACGGTETPFRFEGQAYLYCWHTGTKRHGYIHIESDMPMPDDWYPSR